MSVPGHKQRQDLTGAVIAGDAPLYGGVDSIKHADSLLADAEARAARLWGADWCRFSVAGSTHGNQALALAVGAARAGDHRHPDPAPVAAARPGAGRAAAGLGPARGGPGVRAARRGGGQHGQRRRWPSIRTPAAVFLGDPSYVGTIGDLAGHAEAAHEAGVPLVVDAAWAAHLGFHPDLPPHALAAGADAMVTSAHKALPAYTQAALVLARTERLDPARLNRAFEATHTTSPAGSIMASTDAARALLARTASDCCGAAARARGRGPAAAARGARPGRPGRARRRADKLVVLLAGTGAHGYAVETDLVAGGMPVESADRDTIIPIVTLADDEARWPRSPSPIAIDRTAPRHPAAPAPAAAWTVVPQTVLSPREAFFAANETVAAAAAVGRVSAELVAPYPPGVPVLAPAS